MTTSDDMPIDDTELAHRLIGTWITDPAEKSDYISTTTYNPDGTGTEEVRLPGRPESASVRVTTRWSVKDHVLHMNSLASSDPRIVPIGLKLSDRIVSISDDRFVFEAGEEYGWGKGMQGAKVRMEDRSV
jgi:hypothetical protein